MSSEAQDTARLYATDEAGSTVVLEARRRINYSMRFLTMFSPTAEALASFDRPSVYWRTLFFCFSALDPIQERALFSTDVAHETGMSAISAQRALAMLVTDRVLISTGRKAKKRYRLNNRLAWGSSAVKHNLVEADPEPEDGRGR